MQMERRKAECLQGSLNLISIDQVRLFSYYLRLVVHGSCKTSTPPLRFCVLSTVLLLSLSWLLLVVCVSLGCCFVLHKKK